jgi:hypothetical protein
MCGGGSDGPTITRKRVLIGLGFEHVKVYSDNNFQREYVKDKLLQGNCCFWNRSLYSRPLTEVDLDVTQLSIDGVSSDILQNIKESTRKINENADYDVPLTIIVKQHVNNDNSKIIEDVLKLIEDRREFMKNHLASKQHDSKATCNII